MEMYSFCAAAGAHIGFQKLYIEENKEIIPLRGFLFLFFCYILFLSGRYLVI